MADIRVLRGQSHPLGATVYPDGVNFSVFSYNCTAMELLLFNHGDDAEPAHLIVLDPEEHRTFYYWHAFIEGLKPGQLYGYRAFGPYEPEKGFRFDGAKLLIDPYARAVVYGPHYQREAAKRHGDNCPYAMKSVVVDTTGYDWEGDTPIHHPFNRTVIYEMHAAGFTRNPNSGVPAERRGTYAGLIDKIPYLQELGITSVELLPVQQFDPQNAPPALTNYWGYSPIAFFAPHRDYSARRDPCGPVDEFRDMVKALHRAGIEVILDVVFNHTAEDDEYGPTLSLRGLENRAYYILRRDNRALYENYSGTGNTINSNHSIVRRLIMDCLRYWVQEMHVDGFRFDLASILSRGEDGRPLENPPILWAIESDPVLANTKLIAEAWDAAGLYQVGSFIGDRWAEWNGQYRDNVRQFVRSDPGMVGALASGLVGSSDIYPKPGREPHRSINFITAHDGFTLNDLVSYNEKHNLANGEDNRDGTNGNYSWNCGVEGPSHDPSIEHLRLQQMKNLMTILLVSQGTPMLLMGDEVRNTQFGNNNAYCQDSELSWFNWEDVERHSAMRRFVTHLVRFNQTHRVFHEEQFWTAPGGPQFSWHGVHLHQPDWGHYSHTLAFELFDPADGGEHMYVLLNAFWESLEFELPTPGPGKHWYRVVDTALPSPDDFSLPHAPIARQDFYRAEGRSTVVLMAN